MQITPVALELAVEEGQEQAVGEIFIENRTSIDQVLSLSAVDVRSTGEDGQVAFIDSPVIGSTAPLSAFVRVATGSAILKSGERRRVNVIVQNDQSLSPGGHYAAIVARFRDVDSQKGQETDVIPALSSLLLVRKIGGERYHISLNRVDQGRFAFKLALPDTLHLQFANDGNIHVTPRGVIEVRDLFGRVVRRGIINDASRIVLPGSQRTVPVSLYQVSTGFPLMFYTTTIVGRSEPGDVPFRQEYTFLLLNPRFFILIAVLLVGGSFFSKRYAKRRTNHAQNDT